MKKPKANPLFTRAEKKRMRKVVRHTARRGVARLFGIPLSKGLGGKSSRRGRGAAPTSPSAAPQGVRGEVISGLVNLGYKKSVAEKMAPPSLAGETFDSLFRRSVAKNPAELVIFGNPEKVYRKKNLPLGILEGIGFAVGEHVAGKALSEKRRNRLQKTKRNAAWPECPKCRFMTLPAKMDSRTLGDKGIPRGHVRLECRNKKCGHLFDWKYPKRARRNPHTLDQAKDLYRGFHKREASGVYQLQIDAKRRKDFTILGPLAAVGTNAEKFDHIRPREADVVEYWDKLPHLAFLTPAQIAQVRGLLDDPRSYMKNAPLLASSPNGRQLYVISTEPLQLDLGRFATDTQKDFVDLGEATFVVYLAKKPSQALEWVHTFGEEGGTRPRLTYARLSKELFFTGGSYRVEAPGIVN